MGRPLYTNNAATYLAFGITNTATTMQVSANAGGLFPNPVGGDYFYVSLISLSGPIIEIVKCTARNGDIFTIERGQEGTSPLYWNTGDNVQLRITAAGMNFISGASATTTEEETQTATQGQTVFTLTTFDYTPNTNNLAVFVNGSKQVSGVNFTETSLNTVTFTSGLNAGDVVEFIYGLTIASGTLYATDIKYNEGDVGAVTRTLESKLQESVSVLDFGADPTGATDSTSAIQDAFNIGKSVYIPSGTYIVSSVLSLPQNVVVKGDGNLSIIQGSGNMAVIQLVGTSGTHKNGTVVKDLTISRINGISGSPSIQPVTLTFADNCKFQNVTFNAAGTYQGSFIAQGCTNLQISNCEFNGMGCNITSSDGTSSGTWSLNTIIESCRMISPAQGFDIYYTTNTSLNNCIANNSTSTYGCGFVIELANNGVLLNNCISYGHVRSGFYFEPSSTNSLQDIVLNNCVGYSNGEAGVYMQNMVGTVINGGAFYSNTGTFGTGNGVGLSIITSSDFSITNVLCNNNTLHGMLINGPYIGSISNCQLLSNGGYGIDFTGATESAMSLIGNSFRLNTSGSVNGWSEYNGYWDLGGWVSYTPTFYKSDATTTFTPTTLSVKFKRIGSVVHMIGSFNVSSSTLNGTTYVSAPYSVNWSGSNTGNDAESQLGSCHGSSSGMGYVNSIYYPQNIALNGLSSSDTFVSFHATYEITGQ